MLNLRFDFRLAPFSTTTMSKLYTSSMEMIRWAESVGAYRIMFSQHHSSSDGYLPSPLPLAAAAAAQTTTIPITVGALLLLMYEPVKLAEDISVLDHLSNGRVNYIIGLGYRNEEYAMFGVEPSSRGKLMEEYIDVLQQSLSGEPFTWRDRSIQVTPAPLSATAALLCYGGGTKAAAKRAAHYGMPFVPQNNNPDVLAAYDAEAEKQGNPTGQYQVVPDGCPNSLFVADNVDQAWEEIGAYLLHDAKVYSEWMGSKASDTSTFSASATVEQLRAEAGNYQIVTPEEAIELINIYGYLGLQPLCGGIPPELAWKSLHTIEEKVLPAFKQA